MLNIVFREKSDDDIYALIDEEFGKYADKNGIACGYEEFAFTASDDGRAVGAVRGHSYYNEVHISDLIILEQYRARHIGTRLLEAVESFFAGKGFELITLSTYEFQAPEFYRKCSYETEFVRENKKNPKLTKHFMVKYF